MKKGLFIISHWKKFTTNVLKNVQEDLLVRACTDLGISYDRTINSIRNTWGNERCDAGLIYNGKAIPLGFNFKVEDGKTKLELSGDFFATGLRESSFMDSLSQAYQKYNAQRQLEDQGWIIDSTIAVNSDIVIEAYQWA